MKAVCMVVARPIAARRIAARAGFALVFAVLTACAGELERGEAPIRTGDREAGAPDAAPGDMAPGDAAPGDATPDATHADAAPDPGPLPDRALWIIVRPDPWADGVRAHLDPPHHPTTADPLAALPDAAALIRWRGPGDPATAELEARWTRTDRPTGLIYALGDRLAALAADPPAGPPESWPLTVATADASFLAARLPAAARPLHLDGRPLIIVDADWTDPAARAAFAAAHARYTALAPPARWAALIDPTTLDPASPALPPHIDAIIPRCTTPDPAARARLRAVADAAARTWIPCTTPPRNPRLDHPAALAEPPETAAFYRRLVLARRDAAPILIIDGIGGWRDDRQLDPVAGPDTAAPLALTAGLVYPAYGPDRLAAITHALHRPAGPVPRALADPPLLLELVRTPGVTIDHLDATPAALTLTLRDADAHGRYELLLDDRPYHLPPGATLSYHRTHPAIALDLVFEDGTRLLETLPDAADDDGQITHRLDPFAGRRVEELTLVYRGGHETLDARLERPTLHPAP